VFAPGGSFYSKKIPYITMCRNMLVFENKERNRYFFSLTWLRLYMLEFIQLRSYNNSAGVIYISRYAKNYIEQKHPSLKNIRSEIIYHGISDDFKQVPKSQIPIEKYCKSNPYKLLYISNITYYKHQWVI